MSDPLQTPSQSSLPPSFTATSSQGSSTSSEILPAESPAPAFFSRKHSKMNELRLKRPKQQVVEEEGSALLKMGGESVRVVEEDPCDVIRELQKEFELKQKKKHKENSDNHKKRRKDEHKEEISKDIPIPSPKDKYVHRSRSRSLPLIVNMKYNTSEDEVTTNVATKVTTPGIQETFAPIIAEMCLSPMVVGRPRPRSVPLDAVSPPIYPSPYYDDTFSANEVLNSLVCEDTQIERVSVCVSDPKK